VTSGSRPRCALQWPWVFGSKVAPSGTVSAEKKCSPARNTREPSRTLNAAAVEGILKEIKDEFGSPVHGIEAFAAFIADDGILFRPHAVIGKKWMHEHPLPSSNTRPLLSWQPIYAFISRSGDLGYTTGPWQYKNDIKDAKASAFGNFMTIWKKQANGRWRFVLDLGISNPDPGSPMEPAFSPHALTGEFAAVDIAVSRTGLLNEERAFSKASSRLGAAKAFLLKADVDVRVARRGRLERRRGGLRLGLLVGFLAPKQQAINCMEAGACP